MFRRLLIFLAIRCLAVVSLIPTSLTAQDAATSKDPGPAISQQTSMSMSDMSSMQSQDKKRLPSPHDGSGTSWQPASVTGHEWMWMRSGWELMAHGAIFADYNQQGGARGVGKAESVNWGMLMEQHRLGKGTILFREMFSAESLTSPHPGFPELFQTGDPTTASLSSIISIGIMFSPNWRRCLHFRSTRTFPGNFMVDPRPSQRWDR